MTGLSRWLTRLGRREARVVFLADALIGGQTWGYTWYRLRWFFLTLILLFVVHLIEFWFLYQVFSQRVLVSVVVLRNATLLVNSFFFGALDHLRQRVPTLVIDPDKRRFQREIDGWFSLSLLLSALALLIAAGYVVYDLTWGVKVFRVFQLYWIACLLRVALELPIRALHSVVFGLRRVYRPFFSFAVMDGLGLVIVLILYPWVHVWSFSIALILSAPVAAAVALIYIRRAYREARLPRPHFRWRLVLGPFSRAGQLAAPLGAGVSYAAMRLGSFLVVALGYRNPDEHPSLWPLALLVHLFGPLVNAGVGWGYLYYFDLKKLGALATQSLLDPLRRHLALVSWVIGAGLWLWGSALVLSAAGLEVWPHVLLIAPLFMLRTRMAVLHLELFATRRYGLLFGCAAALVALILALLHWLPAEEHLLPAVNGAVLAALLMAAAAVRWSRPRPLVRGVCSFHEWRQDLERAGEPRAIVTVTLTQAAPTARAMARVVGEKLAVPAVAVVDPRRIAWAEPAQAAPRFEQTLVALSGHAARVDRLDGASASTTTPPAGTPHGGMTVLAQAADQGLFGPDCAAAHGALSPAALNARFDRDFPEGQRWRVGAPPLPWMRQMTSDERHRLQLLAVAFSRSTRPPRAAAFPYDVSALSPKGPIEVIYLIPRTVDPARRADWRRTLRRVNKSAWMNARAS